MIKMMYRISILVLSATKFAVAEDVIIHDNIYLKIIILFVYIDHITEYHTIQYYNV